MQVLPPKILQRQVCSECFNYLTVMPITQMRTGEILCGRQGCFKKSVTLNDGAKSLLNTIMESFEFPCVNYLEGCWEQLSSATSEEHEKQCKYELQECFFCSYKGNWGQIVYHVTREHPSNVTKEFKFCFEIGAYSSQEFIYLNDHDICFITVNVTSNKLTVRIKSANSNDNIKKNISAIQFWPYVFSKDHEEALIDHVDFINNNGSDSYFEKQIKDLVVFFKLGTMLTCQFKLDTVDFSKREHELGIKNAWLMEKVHKLSQEIEYNKTLANGKELNLKIENASLTETLDKQSQEIKDYKKNLQLQKLVQKTTMEGISNAIKQILPYVFSCNKCQTIVEDVLFICDNKHTYCKKCVTTRVEEIDYCDGCSSTNKKFMGFNRIVKLSTFNLNCDWAGCFQGTTMANFLSHKGNCPHRIITCPVLDCSISFRTMQGLKEHWHSKIPLKDIDNVYINKHGYYNWYWLLEGNKLYFVDVKYLETSITGNIDPIHYYNVMSKTKDFEVTGNYNADASCFYFNSSTKETTPNGRFIFSSNKLSCRYGDFSSLRIRLVPKIK